MSIKDKYAFAGVGVSRLGKIPDRSSTELAVDAIEAAIADAGIDQADLDGYVYQPSFDGGPEGTSPLIAAGLPARFAWQLQAGSTTGISSVISAIGALEAGLCKACVVLYATSAASNHTTRTVEIDRRRMGHSPLTSRIVAGSAPLRVPRATWSSASRRFASNSAALIVLAWRTYVDY